MIYATRGSRDNETRSRILAAIDGDHRATLHDLSRAGVIRHINEAGNGADYRCIYCGEPLNCMGWYFAHQKGGNDECAGEGPNPARHGCYVALREEANHPRGTCNCWAYCHLAKQYRCGGPTDSSSTA
jgi:hypothetical protein